MYFKGTPQPSLHGSAPAAHLAQRYPVGLASGSKLEASFLIWWRLVAPRAVVALHAAGSGKSALSRGSIWCRMGGLSRPSWPSQLPLQHASCVAGGRAR